MKTSDNGLAGQTLISIIFIFALHLVGFGQAQTPSYPRMARLEVYQMERVAEIEMARSAAPESISRDAQILVLGRTGYEVAFEGKNGFVCLVQRSWSAGIEDAEFWNPKVRAPMCVNAEAARSFLPHITKKTEWALAGLSKDQISERIKGALDSKDFPAYEPGELCCRETYSAEQDVCVSRKGDWNECQLGVGVESEVAISTSRCRGKMVLNRYFEM